MAAKEALFGGDGRHLVFCGLWRIMAVPTRCTAIGSFEGLAQWLLAGSTEPDGSRILQRNQCEFSKYTYS